MAGIWFVQCSGFMSSCAWMINGHSCDLRVCSQRSMEVLVRIFSCRNIPLIGMDEAKQFQRVLTLAGIVLRCIFGPLHHPDVFVMQAYSWHRLIDWWSEPKQYRCCWRRARSHEEREWYRIWSNGYRCFVQTKCCCVIRSQIVTERRVIPGTMQVGLPLIRRALVNQRERKQNTSCISHEASLTEVLRTITYGRNYSALL